MKEVNDLLKRLGELEDAPLIWINEKVYDIDKEIERLNKLKERYQLEKEVFKDRIEKAIEYMNYTFNISSVKEMYEIMNELEKILQGSDKE